MRVWKRHPALFVPETSYREPPGSLFDGVGSFPVRPNSAMVAILQSQKGSMSSSDGLFERALIQLSILARPARRCFFSNGMPGRLA